MSKNENDVGPGNLATIIEAVGASSTWRMIEDKFAHDNDEKLKKAVADARVEQSQRDNVREQFWYNIGWAGIILAVVTALCVVVFLIHIPMANSAREIADQKKACNTGSTVECIAGVQDAKAHSDHDREHLLRTAYQLATGKPLPPINGEEIPPAPPPSINGFAVKANGQSGVEVSKDGMTINVTPTNPPEQSETSK